jgi:hypothetical protein
MGCRAGMSACSGPPVDPIEVLRGMAALPKWKLSVRNVQNFVQPRVLSRPSVEYLLLGTVVKGVSAVAWEVVISKWTVKLAYREGYALASI